MLIFSSEKSEKLAEEVIISLSAHKGEIERKVFPDGEVYVRILTPVKGKSVTLIHTTQNNDDLIELILTLSALKDAEAEKITCIIPHMLYQRQDTSFQKGEPISAKVVLRIIDTYADEIVTINAHFLDKPGKTRFEGVRITNLDAFPLIGNYFRDLENLIIVSPDEGSKDYAKEACSEVGCPHDHLVKKRLNGETVEMLPKQLDVVDKNVVILDDIIATGGTMVKAAEFIKTQGAKEVYIGCVHGVFTKGIEVFGPLGVVCTNSLPTKLSKVSLAPVIVEGILFHKL